MLWKKLYYHVHCTCHMSFTVFAKSHKFFVYYKTKTSKQHQQQSTEINIYSLQQNLTTHVFILGIFGM